MRHLAQVKSVIYIKRHNLINNSMIMKNILILIFIAGGLVTVYGQEIEKKRIGFHQHDGFYLSMSVGPLFGTISDDLGAYTIDMSGTGAQFDFKIGGAIKENLILHATLISNTLPGPTMKVTNNSSLKASDNLTVGEAMFGVGLTYYMMPSNIFLSGTGGLGNFSIIDSDDSKNNVSTQHGFSMQLKIGKEWWISKNWGFGVGLTYGKTNLTNRPSEGIVEKMDSNRFGILFNTTFN